MNSEISIKLSEETALLYQNISDTENQFNDSQFSEKEVKLPENQHSWHQFAGMYQNNPLFAEVLA